MACEDDDAYEVDEGVAAAIAKLYQVDLFLDLDEARIKRLLRLGDQGELNITGDELRSVVEAHLRQPHDDITLSAPQSVGAFTGVIDVDVSAVLFADPDPSIAHLSGKQYAIACDDGANADGYPDTVMLEPESYDEWVGCYNEALAAIGDDRRFVSFAVADFEEPLYVLATDEQREALADADLVSYSDDEVKLPSSVWADTRATQLAETLRLKTVPARADGGHVVLELDLEAAAALLDKLRADLHHGERVHVLVSELYTAAVRP